MSAQPGSILGSGNYDTLTTTSTTTSTTRSDVFTDTIATLTDGMLSGLTGPFTLDNEAVSISYIHVAQAGGNIFDLQYNNSGLFGGSDNLKFNTDTLTVANYLTSQGTTTGTTTTLLTFDGSLQTINNLSDPLLDSQASTKRYVDNYANYKSTTYSSTKVGVYKVYEVINGIIVRNGYTQLLNDIIPTRAQIVTYLNNIFVTPVSGSSYGFTIINTGINSLIVTPGSGLTVIQDVTITGNITIPSNYTMNSTFIYTNQTSMTLNIDSIGPGINYISALFNTKSSTTGTSAATSSTSSFFNTQFPFKVTDILLSPLTGSTTTSTSYTYTVSDIMGSLIIRNPPGPAFDTFTAQLTDETCAFYIQNISAFNITLTATTNWTFSPTGPLVIGSNKTGYFWISISGTVFTLNVISIL